MIGKYFAQARFYDSGQGRMLSPDPIKRRLANGGKINWKKAIGSAANGAVVGAARGALIGSGAGIRLAFAADFAALQ